jgi:hypothetical protein
MNGSDTFSHRVTSVYKDGEKTIVDNDRSISNAGETLLLIGPSFGKVLAKKTYVLFVNTPGGACQIGECARDARERKRTMAATLRTGSR